MQRTASNKSNADQPVATPRVISRPASIKKEITILLLGESGVGKSTFINAFVNYMTYDSMESARVEKPLCQIPVNFTYSDPDNYELKEITLGTQDDINENTKDATQSATQYPKCYKYLNKDIVLNLIDTPGIADTKGIDKDNKHMKNLLAFISNYPEINAICVLLKPNNARVDVVFKYCLLQLFSHLNKSAADNILFLFTNARSTNYAPGETGPVLRNFLDKLRNEPPNVDIKYSKDTIYCFDNEAFRYLVATVPPNSIPFKPNYVRQHSASWDRSVKETERLLKYIVSLPAHKVQDTVSLNNAKQQILLLTQPLADLSKTISDNQKLCENHRKAINEFNGTIEELKKKLYIPKVSVISVPLDKPKMVCGHKECCTQTEMDGMVNTHYKKNCHSPCYLSDTPSSVIGDTSLQSCKVFKRGFFLKSDKCSECTHSYQVHLYVCYESLREVKEVRDENVYKSLTTIEEASEAKREQLAKMEDYVGDLSKEQAIISRCMAKFVCFLKRNALTPFNDAFGSYVDYLIEVEKRAANNRSTIDKLEQLLVLYNTQVKDLTDAMESTDTVGEYISVQDIEDSIRKLYSLKINGKDIQHMMEVQRECQSNNHVTDKVVNYVMSEKSLFSKIKNFFGFKK